MKQTLAITRKELRGYFGSPMALIFIGSFLAAALFSFFWLDTFFARGIADVRPLFERMPVLLIILVAALAMRQWSEEQRSGTMEVLLTLPVSTSRLVLGKFLAVVALVAIALGLTIFLPLTVWLLGNLDWGPVIGGYLATLLLAAAYTAIGLFVSSRTDNQIVSFIGTILVCGIFYLIGSTGITDFVGQGVGDVFRAIGAGSRFESILRGVIDLRDLLYYVTLTGVFLTLNVWSLKAKGWGQGERTQAQRTAVKVTSLLVVLNLIIVNVWMAPLGGLRIDLTEQREFSLSQATRDILNNLQEPLLIRGYFSERTHPLLAPLVPAVRDMLREYEIASGGMVQLEVVDPAKNPDLEAEANQVYGITPAPFQVQDRYEASVINAYFDILIRYGDQNTVLGFGDLIEVESARDGSFDVRLKNLEYDLTSAIKKTVYGFQSMDAVLASLAEPARLTLFLTPETLPEWLAEAPELIEKVAGDIAAQSGGKFTFTTVNPLMSDSPITPQELYDSYGIQPFATSLFSSESYYLTMLLEVGEEAQVIYPSGDLSEADIRTTLESSLKRASTGFLQVVGLWTPPATPTQDMFGQVQQPLQSWQTVSEILRQEYEVRAIDLMTGQVAADVDVLVVVGPQNLTDVERYAIDQYLMRGGAVILAAGNYMLTPDQFTGGLGAAAIEEGVGSLLESYGITVAQSLVLDPQNEPFPVIVTRQVGNAQVQEIQALDYPFFVDVRPEGMAKNNPLVSNLPAVTLNWVSPITVDPVKNAEREVTVLLQSTDASWVEEQVSAAPTIQPDFDLYPDLGFPVGQTTRPYTLAVSVQGVFESAFKDQPSPLETEAANAEETPVAGTPGTITTSPASARLVVIGSTEFLDDIVFELSSRLTGDRYLNSLKLVQNAVAWATEDLDLLTIRARGTSARVLYELTDQEESIAEAANYVLAFLSLIGLGILWTVRLRNEPPMALVRPDGRSVAGQSLLEPEPPAGAADEEMEVEA
ncbi:MAG: Gldg family protein [Anaerolineae bacterium]|nr:Gldg family protein [Anaerolineae bacterium]